MKPFWRTGPAPCVFRWTPLTASASVSYTHLDVYKRQSFYRIRKHVNLGYYAKGETLAELADALGIDAAELEKTVAELNEAAAAGENDALTGEPFARPFDEKGPYYGVRVEAANHMTKGGVSCNEKAQVLYEDGTPVDGCLLYTSRSFWHFPRR